MAGLGFPALRSSGVTGRSCCLITECTVAFFNTEFQACCHNRINQGSGLVFSFLEPDVFEVSIKFPPVAREP